MRSVIYEEGRQTLVAWAQRESEATTSADPDSVTLNPSVTRYLDGTHWPGVKGSATDAATPLRAALIDGVRAGEGPRCLIEAPARAAGDEPRAR